MLFGGQKDRRGSPVNLHQEHLDETAQTPAKQGGPDAFSLQLTVWIIVAFINMVKIIWVDITLGDCPRDVGSYLGLNEI